MRSRTLCSTVVLLLALVAGAAIAGNTNRRGTAGAQELMIQNSARGLALGGGMVADPGGLEVVYYNPAAIAGVKRVEAYFSNLAYIADMKKNYVAVGVNAGAGSLAFTADILSVGDIPETTEENPEGTGRIFSPNFSILGVSYGRYMSDAVTVGATAKIISENVLQANATGLAFDGGIQYRVGPKGLWFGMAVKNIGPNMRFTGSDFESFHRTSDNPEANERALASQSASFELPSYFEMGARYAVPLGTSSGSIAGFGCFRSNNFSNDEARLGAEYQWHDTVYLRGGGVLNGNSDYNFGPAFGVGFSVPIGENAHLHADYALRTVKSYFDDNHMFAVQFEF